MSASVYEMQKLLAKISLEEEVRKIPLIAAISNNKLSDVKRLISEGADVNLHVPGGGKTPLHMAVDFGHEPIVSFLIEANADVNTITQRGFTPLHVAAQNGNSRLIKLLVDTGANVNARSNVGCTPLHEAAAKGQREATITLLELKADPNLKESRFNLTAANLAHENRHESVRDILVGAMTYQQRFVQNINYILFNWKKSFPESSAEYRFIHKLTSAIVSLEDADEVFRKASAALKTPEYDSIKTTLVPIRSLIIANMKQYNADKLATMRPTAELSPQPESPTSVSPAKK